MRIASGFLAVSAILIVLWEAFETVISAAQNTAKISAHQIFLRDHLQGVNIALLAARAGSSPTAKRFFERLRGNSPVPYLVVCEQWAAEILEIHITYPVLCLFRSQQPLKRWLSGIRASSGGVCGGGLPPNLYNR